MLNKTSWSNHEGLTILSYKTNRRIFALIKRAGPLLPNRSREQVHCLPTTRRPSAVTVAEGYWEPIRFWNFLSAGSERHGISSAWSQPGGEGCWYLAWIKKMMNCYSIREIQRLHPGSSKFFLQIRHFLVFRWYCQLRIKAHNHIDSAEVLVFFTVINWTREFSPWKGIEEQSRVKRREINCDGKW